MLPTLHAGRVTLRPLTDADAAALVDAMLAHPSVARWWGTPTSGDERREELRNEGRAFAIEVDGELAGWLGFEEELEPDYKHASLDISLVPDRQGGGHGPAALRLAARWLFGDRGHHRITIDPAAANDRAGVMRRYEREPDGTWGDGLLMDLLAEELDPA